MSWTKRQKNKHIRNIFVLADPRLILFHQLQVAYKSPVYPKQRTDEHFVIVENNLQVGDWKFNIHTTNFIDFLRGLLNGFYNTKEDF